MFFFLAILLFWICQGYFSQNRLKRLVKQHKDYLGEYAEVTGLFERKQDFLAHMRKRRKKIGCVKTHLELLSWFKRQNKND